MPAVKISMASAHDDTDLRGLPAAYLQQVVRQLLDMNRSYARPRDKEVSKAQEKILVVLGIREKPLLTALLIFLQSRSIRECSGRLVKPLSEELQQCPCSSRLGRNQGPGASASS